MNQNHVLLLFMFPEYDSEYFMSYTSEQIDEAKLDAVNFTEMYPGVLYVAVVFVNSDQSEEQLFRWTNPLAAKLTSLANNAGGAMSPLLTMSGFAEPAGAFFQKLSKKFTNSALASRPPSAEVSAPPSPATSNTYVGRGRRTRQSLPRR